ncbi:type II secretion system protein N [Propionivibrio limicola]|uniref:type II secretion system protein N n=1 Tax=Propionivibrio limicola TaxID=167645 RepID=UPI00129277CF|nr:type II secretion system protein N [Propionivibrio limicola]
MKYVARPGRRSLVVISLLLVVFAVVRAPASLITLLLPPSIQLRNVDGSFWNGQASAVGVGGTIVQEQVEWRFRPQAMLGGKLAWVVNGRFADQASHLDLVLHPRGVELKGVSLVVPLEPFAALHAKLKLAQLGAVLRITTKALGMDAPIAATVAIDHLFTPVAPQGELGSYRLDLNGEVDGKGSWQVTTVAGNLQAAGQGAFDAARGKISGQLTLTPQTPMPGLTPVLSSLPKVGDGFQLAF